MEKCLTKFAMKLWLILLDRKYFFFTINLKEKKNYKKQK